MQLKRDNKVKIVIFHLKFLPYHLVRISALGKIFDTVGVEITDSDKDYVWDITLGQSNNFVWETVFRGRFIESIPRSEQKREVLNILNKHRPDVVVIPGWGWYFCRVALNWARSNNRKSILMSDSKRDDKKRLFIKEYFKRMIVRKFDGAIVGGAAHKEYLMSLGMASQRIMPGFDVVDNDFIAERVKCCIEKKSRPVERKYFLSISRFIKRKNLDTIINAYKMYRKTSRENLWDLVLCGSGGQVQELRRKVREEKITGVHFTGILDQEEICRYLAFSEVFIHAPYQEQWGLVVNEAMAAGKPVIISKRCGCRYDLVRERKNGLLFDPSSVEALCKMMVDVAVGKYDLKEMGHNSQRIIKQWNPELFAHNIELLINQSNTQGDREHA